MTGLRSPAERSLGVKSLAIAHINSSTEFWARGGGSSPSTGTIGGDIPVDGRLCWVEPKRCALVFKRILDLFGGLLKVALHLIVATVSDELIITERLARCLLDLALGDLAYVL